MFPLLSPTTFFLLVINVVYAFFETFAIVDAATHGGPGKDTSILVYKVYYDGFKAMDINGSAAQSVVLMVIVVALTVIQFRFVEKKVHYLNFAVRAARSARASAATMVQRNPILDFFAHLILILGVVVVFFPIYVTFIGSTQTAQQIQSSNPISLLPGQQHRGELPLRAVRRQDRSRRHGGAARCP